MDSVKIKLTRRSWYGMKSRCDLKSNNRYKNYGARGITYCKRWEKFENFVEDMGLQPFGKSIDRIDNNKGYSKSNCKWSSSKEQANNRTTNNVFLINGETLTLSQVCEKYRVNYQAAWARLKKLNWSIEEVIGHKVKRGNNAKLRGQNNG